MPVGLREVEVSIVYSLSQSALSILCILSLLLLIVLFTIGSKSYTGDSDSEDDKDIRVSESQALLGLEQHQNPRYMTASPSKYIEL
jgi:hypothetical protein